MSGTLTEQNLTHSPTALKAQGQCLSSALTVGGLTLHHSLGRAYSPHAWPRPEGSSTACDPGWKQTRLLPLLPLDCCSCCLPLSPWPLTVSVVYLCGESFSPSQNGGSYKIDPRREGYAYTVYPIQPHISIQLPFLYVLLTVSNYTVAVRSYKTQISSIFKSWRHLYIYMYYIYYIYSMYNIVLCNIVLIYNNSTWIAF